MYTQEGEITIKYTQNKNRLESRNSSEYYRWYLMSPLGSISRNYEIPRTNPETWWCEFLSTHWRTYVRRTWSCYSDKKTKGLCWERSCSYRLTGVRSRERCTWTQVSTEGRRGNIQLGKPSHRGNSLSGFCSSLHFLPVLTHPRNSLHRCGLITPTAPYKPSRLNGHGYKVVTQHTWPEGSHVWSTGFSSFYLFCLCVILSWFLVW